MLGFLVLLGGLWTAPACETAFCRCTPPPDVASAQNAADAVFSGHVLSVRDTAIDRGAEHGPFPMRAVTLRVDRAWKGVDSRTVVVLTGMGGGDCGFHFRRGESYLVYAGRSAGGALTTGLCSRTAPVTGADADIDALGSPAIH